MGGGCSTPVTSSWLRRDQSCNRQTVVHYVQSRNVYSAKEESKRAFKREGCYKPVSGFTVFISSHTVQPSSTKYSANYVQIQPIIHPNWLFLVQFSFHSMIFASLLLSLLPRTHLWFSFVLLLSDNLLPLFSLWTLLVPTLLPRSHTI